jgi:hypothetical protein
MGVTAPPPDREQGWFAGSSSGRVVASVVLGFLTVALVIWNLPSSELRNELRPGVRPVMHALALDQSWSVFAPNPTTTSIAVEADVTFADGRVERFVFPEGDDFFGAYREYRWRKWERRVRLDDRSEMWRPTAEWVARQFDEPVTRVVLIRSFSETPEPGSGTERVWTSVEFFDHVIDPADAVDVVDAEAGP